MVSKTHRRPRITALPFRNIRFVIEMGGHMPCDNWDRLKIRPQIQLKTLFQFGHEYRTVHSQNMLAVETSPK